MRISNKPSTVRFTTKGQVVIPSWLRKEFAIEEGTRAVVAATAEGILLKPVTSTSIRRTRGILKNASTSSLKNDWAEHKKQERQLEERRNGRNGT